MARFKLNQREKEGDEEGFETLSNHWLKFRIDQVENELKAENFDEAQTSYGLSRGVSTGREKADMDDEAFGG